MTKRIYQDASGAILKHRLSVSETMVEQQYARCPELLELYGERGRAKCGQDANFHIDYLAESLAVSQPLLFADYLAWAKIMLAGRNIPVEDLVLNLDCLCDALRQYLDKSLAEAAVEYVTAGMEHLAAASATQATFIPEGRPLAALAREYLAALLTGDRQRASRLVLDTVAGGVAVQDVYLWVFQPSQQEVGRLWQMNEISVAQEHYCTAATQLVMSQLYPYLFGGERIGRTLVATCISGDMHEIGVRMVSDIFELNGWDTYYLGANTPIGSILQTVREQHADVLGISATIVPHLQAVGELIDQVRSAPDCGHVKILVGGYPFNIAPDMWREMGADGCAHDAVTSVAMANSLVCAGRVT